MRWAGHVAYRLLAGNLRERDHLENYDIDGRIILKWISVIKPT
jgi:hypothetical protein